MTTFSPDKLTEILDALERFSHFPEDVFSAALELYSSELGVPLWQLFELGTRYLNWDLSWE